jgi:hypothetical protein
MTPDATWLAVERIWCEALLPEGAEVIQRVTTRVLALRPGKECDRIGGCLRQIGMNNCKCTVGEWTE